VSIDDFYDSPKVSRKSPGIFGYIYTFQSIKFLVPLFFGLPLGTGIMIMFLNFLETGALNLMLVVREAFLFSICTISGTLACYILRDRTPLFTIRISYLINAYGTGMFAASYIFGYFLSFFLESHQFREIFFIMGALVAYIVLFVVYFSFTRVGPPWYIILALIQPVMGILMYSFISEQVELVFFLKAVVFFMVSAAIFALGYGPMMAAVSLPYRHKTGVGGYNFVRAFVEALLLDDHDAAIERYFQDFSETRELVLQYIAFRETTNSGLKGLFSVPNVHFGPFKTAGSAAFGEKIYQSFSDIPGITVFHTTTTHAENFASHDFNNQAIQQMKEDMTSFNFSPLRMTKFHRIYHEKTKILGTLINGTPFLMFTRHPYPTDDISPAVGQEIRELGKKYGYSDTIVIDCHNSLIGDEVMVEKGSEEAKEMVATAERFFEKVKEKAEPPTHDVLYGVAGGKIVEYPIASGIGAGGIIVHYFKVAEQETILIHIDGNNALTPVRSAMVNLGENQGLDRVELSTSDTHAVVRILSSQGYFPIGSKIGIGFLENKIRLLIEQARKNALKVDAAIFRTETPGYRFWKNISFFDIIVETIERSVTVSKILLTVGLVIPALMSLIMMLFFY
jgi:predicted neutral ceramidase superfamily lipid hydrolase